MTQGPGFLITFVYYFTCIWLIGVVVITQGLGGRTPLPYQLSLLFALVAGLSGATVNRSATLTIPFRDRHRCRAELETILNNLGFEHKSQLDPETTLYQKSPWRAWLAGKIYVQWQDQAVAIGGRMSDLNRLRPHLEKTLEAPISAPGSPNMKLAFSPPAK
ncbi:MAG: hypothetical protein HC890_04220 [Chloroflexaceae bacterium]|nr:hypothetical protein [Chloroflexaceae bacterium]